MTWTSPPGDAADAGLPGEPSTWRENICVVAPLRYSEWEENNYRYRIKWMHHGTGVPKNVISSKRRAADHAHRRHARTTALASTAATDRQASDRFGLIVEFGTVNHCRQRAGLDPG